MNDIGPLLLLYLYFWIFTVCGILFFGIRAGLELFLVAMHKIDRTVRIASGRTSH